MNFKSLFASVGFIISSLFTPMKASANVYGNLLVPDLLYPSFEIDSMLVQNGSNLTFATYPNLFDVKQSTRYFSSGSISSASEIGVLTLTGGTSANYLGHAPLLKSTVDSRTVLGDTIAILNVNGNPYRYNDSSSRSFNSVDLIYTANDIVISQTDLNDIAFNLYSFSQSNNGTLDYTLKFTLKSKTSSAGDYQISSYNFDVEHFGINLDSFASFDSAYMYSIDLFDEFDFSEEEEYLWLTDFELHIGYSIESGATTSVAGFGWDMPYYTSDVYVQNTSFDNWLLVNGLDASDVDCPTCQECPTCPPTPICPGDNNINVSYTDWLTTAIGGFFDFELFPGFSFGGVIAIVFILLFVLWVLKMIAGG